MQVLGKFNDITMGSRIATITMPEDVLVKPGEVAMVTGIPTVGGDFDPFKDPSHSVTADEYAAANLQLLLQTISCELTQPVLCEISEDFKKVVVLLPRDYSGVHLSADFYGTGEKGIFAYLTKLVSEINFYDTTAANGTKKKGASAARTNVFGE